MVYSFLCLHTRLKPKDLVVKKDKVNLSIGKYVIYLALLKNIKEVPRERIVIVFWNQEIYKSLRASNKVDPRNAVMEQ